MNTLETLILLNSISFSLFELQNVFFAEENIINYAKKEKITIETIKKQIPSSSKLHQKLNNIKLNLNKEIKQIERNKIKIIPFYHKDYPEKLLHIQAPPLILYVKGNLKKEEISIAIVGSRKCTIKGKKTAYQIAYNLSLKNITIISGLAYGIDTEAHKAAVDCKKRTIAVLGSGLNHLYPKENLKLAEEIIHYNGAIVSEFPINTKPYPYNFPRRNRIISGMANGVCVVEAKKKSGSLITARIAAEQGKDVFCVPGHPTDKMHEGTNDLIKEGAKLTTSANDILTELNIHDSYHFHQDSRVQMSSNLSNEEKEILKAIEDTPLTIEKISEKTKINLTKISHILLTMELKKYIKVFPGNKYGINYRKV